MEKLIAAMKKEGIKVSKVKRSSLLNRIENPEK